MVIGIIGRGPWGAILEKAFRSDARVHEVLVRGRAWQDLLDTRLSGVVVACPPEFRPDIARTFLERGTPLFLEKPLALSREDAEPLVELAQLRPSTPVLVDHIVLFSDLYQRMREQVRQAIAAGGSVDYFYMSWTGQKERHDTHPLWDYGSHAVAIALDLLGGDIEIVWDAPTGLRKSVSFAIEGSPLLRHGRVTTGWNENYASRRLSLQVVTADERRTLTFDDLRKEIIEHLETTEPSTGIRPPALVHSEVEKPLDHAVRVFVDAIEGKPDPRLGLALGVNVVNKLAGLERAASLR